jgi:hypothetical protein
LLHKDSPPKDSTLACAIREGARHTGESSRLVRGQKLSAEGAQHFKVVDKFIARQDEELRRKVSKNEGELSDKSPTQPPPAWSDLLGRE